MRSHKLRDEQKGTFFLLIILFIIIAVSVFMIIALRTDAIGEKLAGDQVIRVLNVMDDKEGMLFLQMY